MIPKRQYNNNTIITTVVIIINNNNDGDGDNGDSSNKNNSNNCNGNNTVWFQIRLLTLRPTRLASPLPLPTSPPPCPPPCPPVRRRCQRSGSQSTRGPLNQDSRGKRVVVVGNSWTPTCIVRTSPTTPSECC